MEYADFAQMARLNARTRREAGDEAGACQAEAEALRLDEVFARTFGARPQRLRASNAVPAEDRVLTRIHEELGRSCDNFCDQHSGSISDGKTKGDEPVIDYSKGGGIFVDSKLKDL